MNEIIYCKDCEYCDTGINEEGKPFFKCLSGYSYGGTTPMDFCSHAEIKNKTPIKNALNEISSAAAYGIVYCLDTVPVHTQTLVEIFESFSREHKIWIDIRSNPPKLYEEVILAAKHRNGTWDIRIDKFCGFTPDNRALSGTYTENWDIKYWMPKPQEPEGN